MKKIFFPILLAILAASCTKDLNQVPISAGTTATFYQSPSDFIQGVNAIYNDLRAYPDRLMNLSEIRSDNIYGVSALGVRDWDPINDFQKTIAGNVYVEEGWNTDFNGIFRANTLLDQIARHGSNINSTALATRLTAEARYLRAFYYFDLVKYYGKVPIVDHPVLAAEAATIKRSPVKDVYNFITADLAYAAANLPAAFTGIDVGRATKYAAEATLAQVYMTQSGPTYGIEGPGLGISKYDSAMPLLQDIISSGKYTFLPSYSSIFSYTNQNNGESILSVQYIGGQNPNLGATFLWDLVPQNYFSSFNANKTSNGGLEIIPVSNDLLNDYDSTDKRKKVNIHQTGYTFSGSFEPRPFFSKYLDTTKIPTTSRFDWAIDFIAIRYTDILMLKAECILNGTTGGTQTDVDSIVNLVRVRAGLPTLTNVTLDQLFDERRKEFAAEGSRWFDLQRSGNLVTRLNNWIPAEDYKHQMNAVIPQYVIYPVPQSQLDAVQGLYSQNTGY